MTEYGPLCMEIGAISRNVTGSSVVLLDDDANP